MPTEQGKPPICKIIDKKQSYEQSKAKAKNSKNSKNPGLTNKAIELSWVIEKGDLSHRLKKMKDFLEKGFKVEISVAQKRRGKVATPEQAREVLQSVLDTIEGTEGARQSKPKTGKIGSEMTIFAEGSAKAAKGNELDKGKQKGKQKGEKAKDIVVDKEALASA
jgi:translation initiation factor IF-3